MGRDFTTINDSQLQEIVEAAVIIPPDEFIVKVKYNRLDKLTGKESDVGVVVKGVEIYYVEGIDKSSMLSLCGVVSGATLRIAAEGDEHALTAEVLQQLYTTHKEAMAQHGSCLIETIPVKKGL